MSIVLVSLAEKSDATENYSSGPEPTLIWTVYETNVHDVVKSLLSLN
jgi:hypothetical protein